MILESGAKARTIKKYLGKGWIVDACNGHVQDLPNRGGSKQDNKAMWSSKEGELPEPPWSWTDRAENTISKLRQKAESNSVEEIYIATDPDREGEFIAWRLKEIFSDFEIIHRVSFNEITNSAVQEAISSPRDVDMDLVDAAKVRRFMDRLVGFRCSRFSRSWNLASMGRVQTPTLGFIVDRELEREAHVPIPYHSIKGDSNGVSFKVRFHEKDEENAWKDDDGKHHPDRTFDKELAKSTLDRTKNAGQLTIASVNEGKNHRKPQPPFTTESMLRAANGRMGWSIGRTNRVATALYQSGHITYIRTDSTRTSKAARDRIRSLIEKEYGTNHLGLGVLGSDVKKGAGNVQDAHEAIRPTQPEVKTLTGTNADQQSLYRLIWGRFAASQMSDSIRERRDIVATVENVEMPLYGTSSWRIHTGWEAVYSEEKEVRTEPPQVGFEIGSNWLFSKSEENPSLTSDQTKPPRRFTESSIIREMKNADIGRPSTYLTTIGKLVDRDYVNKDGASLIPTEQGRTLWIDVVPFYGSDENSSGTIAEGLFTPRFTALMEANLDQVEEGDTSGAIVWHQFVSGFRNMHNNALELRKQKPTIKQMNFIKSRLSRMPEETVSQFLNGKEYENLTGEDARRIIEELNNSDNGDIPPSEKQMTLILRLVDKNKVDLDRLLASKDLQDLEELTGGRDGTASAVINELIQIDKNSPATEKQVATIQSMAKNLQIRIEDAMALADTTTIEEITKDEASGLIDRMKKMIQSRKRQQKK
ncbi:MAG: type IA DNA topoisomerase [Candidatus Thermoplasmatota archaeon]|nr:type IA DNA topoisomerase [Candidatus Thermoplasmatota archaeon]